MSEAKLFGKYNEYVLVLFGFVLTALLGGFVTYGFQERESVENRRVAQVDFDIQRTDQLYKHIIDPLSQLEEQYGIVLGIRASGGEDRQELSKYITEVRAIVGTLNSDTVSLGSTYGEGVSAAYVDIVKVVALRSLVVLQQPHRTRARRPTERSHNTTSIEIAEDVVDEDPLALEWMIRSDEIDRAMLSVIRCKNMVRDVSVAYRECITKALPGKGDFWVIHDLPEDRKPSVYFHRGK
jgi:hypothetical protein